MMEELFTRLETEWMNAWKQKDETTLRNFLADEFVLTSSLSKGELVNKEQWIDKALQHYHGHVFEIRKLQVRQYGDVVVCNITSYQEATANGNDWNGTFLLTDIWVNKNDQWQVVDRHSSWLK